MKCLWLNCFWFWLIILIYTGEMCNIHIVSSSTSSLTPLPSSTLLVSDKHRAHKISTLCYCSLALSYRLYHDVGRTHITSPVSSLFENKWLSHFVTTNRCQSEHPLREHHAWGCRGGWETEEMTSKKTEMKDRMEVTEKVSFIHFYESCSSEIVEIQECCTGLSTTV